MEVYLKLLQYQQPAQKQKKTKQLSNKVGVSHVAFTVENIDRICEQVVQLGGGLVNEPALMKTTCLKWLIAMMSREIYLKWWKFSEWRITIFL